MKLTTEQYREYMEMISEYEDITAKLRPLLPQGALNDSDHNERYGEYGEAASNLYAVCRRDGFHGQRDRVEALMDRLGEKRDFDLEAVWVRD